MNEQSQAGTVIVTGSSGLIGRGVVQRLAEKYRVACLDIVPPKGPLPPGASFMQCDLTSSQSVDAALDEVRQQFGNDIASVVHLAAYVDFSGEPSDKYDTITLKGTERILLGLTNFQVEQFIFSSTMLVHAPSKPGKAIDEESPLQPKWAYPQSKVKTEQLILDNRGDIPVVLLRIAGVYDDYGHSLPLSHQIQRIYEKQITGQVFPGNLTHGQALIHYDDLTESFWLTVERRKDLPDELTLLIGEAVPVSYDELQRTISHLIHGKPMTTWRVPKPLAMAGAWVQGRMASGDEPFIRPWMIDMADDHYELNISRAKETIGWQPKHNLRDTLPRIIESLERDPVAWYREHKLTLPESLKQRAKAG